MTMHSFGGAIYTSDNALFNFNGSSNFVNNSAGLLGGAFYAKSEIVLSSMETITLIITWHAIYVLDNSVLVFTGSSNFVSNSTNSGIGGVIFSFTMTFMTLNFSGIANFDYNSAHKSGGIISKCCT